MDVLVSICCITYNHEKYIRETLDGFLIQKTRFPFEIIIHDDASTDKTAEIIKEYAKKDDRIKPILQSENQWSQGIKPSFKYVWPKAKGKYIALCEGDDFWTNSNKLQKQVDFLEENDDYVGAFHNVSILNTYNNQSSLFYSSKKKSTKYGMGRIICKNPVPTLSVIFRKNLSLVPDEYPKYVVGDWPLHILNSQYGPYYYINEVMGCYRIHSGGIHQGGTNWTVKQKREYLKGIIYMLKSVKNNLSKPNYILSFRILFDKLRIGYFNLINFLKL